MLLPELLALIAPHLDPPSLVSTTQVSRFWCTCFTPILWSTIKDSDWILPNFSPRQLYAHGHLVHSLAWDSLQSQPHSLSLTHSSSPPSSSSLEKEKIAAGIMDKDYHDHGTELRQMMRVIPVDSASRLPMRCLAHIVARCTHLQRLKLNFGAHNGDQQSEEGKIVRGMVQVIQSLKLLQELELVAHSVLLLPEDKDFNDDDNDHHDSGRRAGSASRGLNVQWLIQDLTHLQSLTLRGSAFWFESPSSPLSIPSPTETKTTSPLSTTTGAVFPISHLSLEPAASALTEEALMLFVQQCPRLTSLDLPGGLTWEISVAFTKHLQSSCPNFDSFSINASSASLRGHSLLADPVDLLTTNNAVENDTPTAALPTAATQSSTTLHVRIIPEDDRLAALIRGLTKRTEVPLRSLGARSCYFGNSSLQALEEECPDLERLDISLNRASSNVFVSNLPADATTTNASQERTILSRNRLVQYLKKVRSLKELSAEGVWIDLVDLVVPLPPPLSQEDGGEHGDPVNVEQAQQQQLQQRRRPLLPTVDHWVCASTLTHLVLGFTASNASHQSHFHSSAILYTFLSSLKSLRELKISNTTLTDFQPPTISASVSPSPQVQSSSFHLLSALRDLREFDIETCSYSPSGLLNRDTIQWMVGQAWPKLESLHIYRLSVSQERELYGWLKEIGRDRLVVNGYCNRVLRNSNCNTKGRLGTSQENSALSSVRLMNMMMSY